MKENEEKNKGLHIALLVVGSIVFIVLMVMMSSSNAGRRTAGRIRTAEKHCEL